MKLSDVQKGRKVKLLVTTPHGCRKAGGHKGDIGTLQGTTHKRAWDNNSVGVTVIWDACGDLTHSLPRTLKLLPEGS